MRERESSEKDSVFFSGDGWRRNESARAGERDKEARERETVFFSPKKKKKPESKKKGKKPFFFQNSPQNFSQQAEDEYMISDLDPPPFKFVSVPRDLRGLNCAAFAAGAVRGALAAAGFPARVTAHFVPVKGGDPKKPKTTILIKFDASVMAREAGKWAG